MVLVTFLHRFMLANYVEVILVYIRNDFGNIKPHKIISVVVCHPHVFKMSV